VSIKSAFINAKGNKMKIVHVCLCGPMTDGLSYQENVLSKFHKKLGHDVTVIASKYIWDKNGNVVITNNDNYFNSDGVKMIRLHILAGGINNRFKVYLSLLNTLESEKPDILFIHDCQFVDIITLAKYLEKHRNVTAYVDNHVDYTNGARGWVSKYILHKGLWKLCIKRIEPYVKKFYGVLPARVDFLTELYGLPKEKCELLLMGADDDLVKISTSYETKDYIRKKYSVGIKEYLLVTGGKINSNRPETLELMQAVTEIENLNVKLLIFGIVSDELKKRFDELCKNPRIIYAGWKSSAETYSLMASADLVVFPGLHSVMWEQSVALGVPGIYRDIKGFHHIDVGGNVAFFDDITSRGIKKTIISVIGHKENLDKMRFIAKDKGAKLFSFEEIAKRSIQ